MKTAAIALAFVTVLSGLAAAQDGGQIPPRVRYASNPVMPEQAQASAMAVPEPGPEYVSALLVVHCRKVEALVLIDSHGVQHPYHGKEATLAQVLTMLSPVPADNITQVTVACPGELGL
jgi:hypothetical protein